MRKLIIVLLIAAGCLIFSGVTYAQTLYLVYDGSTHVYQGNVLTLKLNGETIQTDVPPVILDDRTLVPVRAVFEKMGAEVKWDAVNRKVQVAMDYTTIELRENDRTALVNGKGVAMDVPFKIINDRTMVPVRFISEQLNMKVGWSQENYLVTIDSSTLGNISHSVIKGSNKVVIYVDSANNYQVTKLDNPSRLVVDIPNVVVPSANSFTVSSNTIRSITSAQYNSSTARIVFELAGDPEYTVSSGTGFIKVNIDNTPPVAPKTMLTNASISHGIVGTKEEVCIAVNDYTGYSTMNLTNPSRLVIDLPNVDAPAVMQTIDINKTIVKSIRYAYFNNTAARIVIDLNVASGYEVIKESGLLKIQFSGTGGVILPPEPDILTVEGLLSGVSYIPAVSQGNIAYYNKTDRIHFIFKGQTKLSQVIQLPDGSLSFQKLYTESYDLTGNKYTVTFPSSQTTLTECVIPINDAYLNSIKVTKQTATGKTSITFDAKSKFSYQIHTRYDDYDNMIDTAITLLKPATKADKLVVIDPGHGGWEVGASYKNVKEKELNLDIALRLDTLLKARGVNTYMLREDDSYVGLRERAYIANELNASLFLSIHNNGYNSQARGTETLYFPNGPSDRGMTGQRFAQIIEDKLTAAIGTANRGIIPRPGLAVLKYTTIPAALVEVAFLDNREDREMLLKQSTRQNAAAAICNAIVQALAEMK